MKQFMENPDRWPIWPALPLKRYHVTRPLSIQPETGIFWGQPTSAPTAGGDERVVMYLVNVYDNEAIKALGEAEKLE